MIFQKVLKIMTNVLKSDCSVSQELLIKEPTEEHVKTDKDRQVSVRTSGTWLVSISQQVNHLLSPRDGSSRTIKIRKV